MVDGQFGKALHFKSNLNSNDPNGDYLTGESFEIGGAISVAVWVKYLQFGNWMRMIDFGNAAGQKNLVFANEGGGRSGAWDIKQTAGGDENFRIGNFISERKCMVWLGPRRLVGCRVQVANLFLFDVPQLLPFSGLFLRKICLAIARMRDGVIDTLKKKSLLRIHYHGFSG